MYQPINYLKKRIFKGHEAPPARPGFLAAAPAKVNRLCREFLSQPLTL